MPAVFDLEEVKALVKQEGKTQFTDTCLDNANAEYGFSKDDIKRIIQELTPSDYKQNIVSKTTGRKNDVYMKKIHSPIYGRNILTYIKFEILKKLIIISFHTST